MDRVLSRLGGIRRVRRSSLDPPAEAIGSVSAPPEDQDQEDFSQYFPIPDIPFGKRVSEGPRPRMCSMGVMRGMCGVYAPEVFVGANMRV